MLSGFKYKLPTDVANICLIQHFRIGPEGKRHLIIANAHLYWNPDYDVVKYLQMSQVLNALTIVRKKIRSKKVGIVLAGDLNSFRESTVSLLVEQKPLSF